MKFNPFVMDTLVWYAGREVKVNELEFAKEMIMKSEQTAAGQSLELCSVIFPRARHSPEQNAFFSGPKNKDRSAFIHLAQLLSPLVSTRNATKIFSRCLSLSNWRAVFQWHQGRMWEKQRGRNFSVL